MASIASISSTSTSFDDPIVIDEKMPVISEHFLEKIDYRTIDKIKKLSTALYFLISTAAMVPLTLKFGPVGWFIGVIHLIFAETVFLDTMDQSAKYPWHKGYRNQIRLDLNQGKMPLRTFLEKHTWQEIRIWGLFLPEDKNPLITKKELIDAFLKSSYSLFSFKSIYQYENYFSERIWSGYTVDQVGILEQFAEQNLQFDEEQKKLFEEKYFPLLKNYSDLTLIQNLNSLNKLNLLDKMDKERRQVLEKKAALFEIIWGQYKKARNALFNRDVTNCIELSDVCNIRKLHLIDFSNIPAGKYANSHFYAKHLTYLNEWFTDQVGALIECK